jgi:hypothetical protein
MADNMLNFGINKDQIKTVILGFANQFNLQDDLKNSLEVIADEFEYKELEKEDEEEQNGEYDKLEVNDLKRNGNSELNLDINHEESKNNLQIDSPCPKRISEDFDICNDFLDTVNLRKQSELSDKI